MPCHLTVLSHAEAQAVTPTFRWSVVLLSSSWVEGRSLSSRIVSAPLQ